MAYYIPYHLAIYSINGRPFITPRDTVCNKRSFILQLSRLSSSRPSGYPPSSLPPKLPLTSSLPHVTHYKKSMFTRSSATYKPSLISTVAHTGRPLHSTVPQPTIHHLVCRHLYWSRGSSNTRLLNSRLLYISPVEVLRY